MEAQTDQNSLFPLKPGRTITAKSATDSNGQRGTLSVEMAVKGADIFTIGPCKYSMLKIDRSEPRSADSPRFVDTDYYSPDLKLVLAKEYRESGGGTHTIKYDLICSLKP